MYADFYTSIEVAKWGMFDVQESIRLTKVLLVVQTATTLLNCFILVYFSKESYYLVMAPFDLPKMLGVFLSIFGLAVTFTFIFASYIKTYVHSLPQLERMLRESGSIKTILYLSLTAMIFGIVFTYFNYMNTRSRKPKTNRYFVFGFVFFLFAAIMFANVEILITDLKNFQMNQKSTCNDEIKSLHR